MLWLSSCARGQVVEPEPPTPITRFTPALWKRWEMDCTSWSDATASVACTLSSAVNATGIPNFLSAAWSTFTSGASESAP